MEAQAGWRYGTGASGEHSTDRVRAGRLWNILLICSRSPIPPVHAVQSSAGQLVSGAISRRMQRVLLFLTAPALTMALRRIPCTGAGTRVPARFALGATATVTFKFVRHRISSLDLEQIPAFGLFYTGFSLVPVEVTVGTAKHYTLPCHPSVA